MVALRWIIFFVVSGLWLAGCTFSNNLSLGDYVQQPKSTKLATSTHQAAFYVTCTSFARGYDQVVKSSDCKTLSLVSIFDASVQQEILSNFRQLSFVNSWGVQTQRPDSKDVEKIVHLDIHEEYGWPRMGFQVLVSTLTVTLIPLNYPRDYTITLSIENQSGDIEKSVSRDVRINNWWWMPLMFSYPFYNEKRASENILLHTGRDLVRELESL